MIRPFVALFGATIAGCGSLYTYGHIQDLQRDLTKTKKDRDMYKSSYEFLSEQRQLQEKEVKDLQEKLKELESNQKDDTVVVGGLVGLVGLGAASVYALSQMR